MSKSVLITGTSRGLGAGIARQFAARGYKLALTGRKYEELEKLDVKRSTNTVPRAGPGPACWHQSGWPWTLVAQFLKLLPISLLRRV